MLKVDGLAKHYATVKAVDNVSLEIPEGQLVGIIGRSGAGKSTLLRLMNRLVEPTAGRIFFGGRELTALKGAELRRWRSRCAMIFQQFNLVNRLDVITNVLIGRVGHRSTLSTLMKSFAPAERAMAIHALHRLDMDAQALQRAETLSGGQQQRVAIARALLQEPEIVLADEPIASLDPRNAAKVMDALKTINREDGITVIVNLHHLDTAREYCDRIVGMAAGRIVFDGAPRDLSDASAREIYGQESSDAGLETVRIRRPHQPALDRLPGAALANA
ncbi:MAG: phosphonate ABC transporter ATP-binding protein [Alphaproteobacteria bacterium]|nr:phosphonate ABC transporter ATP-binding protein [Alphaproteobacteria bacterium]